MYFTDKSLKFVLILSNLQTSPAIIANFVPIILYERLMMVHRGAMKLVKQVVNMSSNIDRRLVLCIRDQTANTRSLSLSQNDIF